MPSTMAIQRRQTYFTVDNDLNNHTTSAKMLHTLLSIVLICAVYTVESVSIVSSTSVTNGHIHAINQIAIDTLQQYNTSTLHQLSSAVSTLQQTDSLNSYKSSSAVCQYVQKHHSIDTSKKTPLNVQNLYYTVNINQQLNCKYDTSKYIDLVNFGITSAYVPNIYYTVQTIELLTKHNKMQLSQKNQSELKSLIPTLVDYIDKTDGTSKLSAEVSETSIYGTALNLYSIGVLYQLIDNKHTQYSKQYDNVKRYAEDILSTIVDNNIVDVPQSHLPSLTNTLTVVAQLVSAIHAVGSTSDKPLKLNNEHISVVSTYLTDNYYTHDIVELSSVISAIYTLTDMNVISNIPVVLTVQSITNDKLSIILTDSLDKAITDASIELTGVKSITVSDSTATGTLTHTSNGIYTLSHKLTAGIYTASYSVKGKNTVTLSQIERTVIVTRKFSGATLTGTITDNTGKSSKSSKPVEITYPSTIKSKLDVDATKVVNLHLTLSDTDLQPDTIYAVVAHNGIVSKYWFKSSKTSAGYDANINIGSAVFLEHSSGNGAYEITVYIGDTILAAPVHWSIGCINVELPSIAIPKQKTDIELWTAQPEIYHIFPRAERRPNKLIALIFSAVSVIPFVGLLYYIRPVLSTLRLPSNPRELLAGTIFQGSIATMIGIFVLYWLRLNIFSAMTLLLIVSVVAVFSGTETLRSLHVRTQTELSSKKTE